MLRRLPLALLLLVPLTSVEAQPKKDGPKIIGTAPLGVVPGTAVKLTIRGLKLDTATEVRVGESRDSVKILNKSKVMPPNQVPPTLVGDTQVQVELKLPPNIKGPTVPLVVITPEGETTAHALLVDSEPLVAEKEPNNGFRQAQPVQLGQIIDGLISQNQDVDVFRFDGSAGQRVVIEVFASRHGSPLDPVLTLFDAAGNILAVDDDGAGHANDARLEITLRQSGMFYLSVADAHDLGGPTHFYRLRMTQGK